MGSKNIEILKKQFNNELNELKEINELKLKLEKEGIDNIKNGKNVIQIIKNGEKEFIEKIGRNMSYSEMREMYG